MNSGPAYGYILGRVMASDPKLDVAVVNQVLREVLEIQKEYKKQVIIEGLEEFLNAPADVKRDVFHFSPDLQLRLKAAMGGNQ